MTTNKPLFVMGLAKSEPALAPASRPSRKTDGAFADMLEARGTAESTAQQGSADAGLSGGQGNRSDTTDQVKKQAFDAMSKLIDSDPSNGGVYKPQAISAMRTLLSSTLEMPGGASTSAASVSSGTKAEILGAQSVPSPAKSGRIDQTERPQQEAVLQGIALPDRSRGIPLDARQQRGLAVHNIALNRNRPRQSNEVAETQTARSMRTTRSLRQKVEELGSLAARYESGSEGIAAIGYDRNGGTSYGKYQIASRPGTMTGFLSFLEGEAPDLAERLSAAGPANTGSRKGDMPDVWRSIASEEPERFEDLQERFIRQSHYEPALNAVQRAGYDVRSFSPAMKEVLWSTAVQHGPSGAASIFAKAAEGVGLGQGKSQQRQEKDIINEVYSLRADKFGSSTPQIQAAARQRMESEKELALALTGKKNMA